MEGAGGEGRGKAEGQGEGFFGFGSARILLLFRRANNTEARSPARGIVSADAAYEAARWLAAWAVIAHLNARRGLSTRNIISMNTYAAKPETI